MTNENTCCKLFLETCILGFANWRQINEYKCRCVVFKSSVSQTTLKQVADWIMLKIYVWTVSSHNHKTKLSTWHIKKENFLFSEDLSVMAAVRRRNTVCPSRHRNQITLQKTTNSPEHYKVGKQWPLVLNTLDDSLSTT